MQERETQRARSEIAPVTSAHDALGSVYLPTLDPSTMSTAEIRIVLDGGPICVFRYVSDGKPVLAFLASGQDAFRGVIKVNGSLVPLSGIRQGTAFDLTAGEIRTTLTSVDPHGELDLGALRSEANLRFHVGARLTVGYRGYYSCEVATRATAVT
jgi:hypothetical protein